MRVSVEARLGTEITGRVRGKAVDAAAVAYERVYGNRDERAMCAREKYGLLVKPGKNSIEVTSSHATRYLMYRVVHDNFMTGTRAAARDSFLWIRFRNKFFFCWKEQTVLMIVDHVRVDLSSYLFR